MIGSLVLYSNPKWHSCLLCGNQSIYGSDIHSSLTPHINRINVDARRTLSFAFKKKCTVIMSTHFPALCVCACVGVWVCVCVCQGLLLK